jgi:hypothetical protein
MAYANIGTVFAAPLTERDTKPSLFKRILTAMTESRMRAAQREINAHAHLFQDSAGTIRYTATPAAKSEIKLPFTG